MTIPSEQTSRIPSVLVPIGLVLLTLFVFWPIHTADFFNYDDPEFVTQNPLVVEGLKADHLYQVWTSYLMGLWAPVTWTSYLLDVELFGMSPGPMHVVNVVWHTISVLLLFFILFRSTGALWRSALVAAVFAIHPLRVESVAWIAERKDVLSVCFGLAAVWTYMEYVRSSRLLPYFLTIFCFLLCLMSKAMLVTLPFVLLLIDYWPLDRWRRVNIRRLILEKLPLFILTIFFCILTVLGHQQYGAVQLELPLSNRLEHTVIAYIWYILKLWWPAGLTFFYAYSDTLHTWPRLIGAVLILTGLSVVTLKYLRTKPYLIIGWLWFLGTLVPAIGLVQAGMQAWADRYMYFPMIGILIMIIWSVADLADRWRLKPFGLAIASGILLIVLMAVSRMQLTTWQNTETAARHALQVTSGNFIAMTLLGSALEDKAPSEALRQYQAAMKTNPWFFLPYVRGGKLLEQLDRPGEAVGYYAAALRLDPTLSEFQLRMGQSLQKLGRLDQAIDVYLDLNRRFPGDPQMHQVTGAAYEALGDFDLALLHYNEAAELDPTYTLASEHKEQLHEKYAAQMIAGLGVDQIMRRAHRLHRLQKYTSSLQFFRQALLMTSEPEQVYIQMGDIYAQQDSLDQAVALYQQVLTTNPRAVAPKRKLGTIYLKQGRTDLAIEQYEAVLAKTPDDIEAHYYLGNIQLASKDLASARRHYEAVLNTDPSHFAARRRLQAVMELMD